MCVCVLICVCVWLAEPNTFSVSQFEVEIDVESWQVSACKSVVFVLTRLQNTDVEICVFLLHPCFSPHV